MFDVFICNRFQETEQKEQDKNQEIWVQQRLWRHDSSHKEEEIDRGTST